MVPWEQGQWLLGVPSTVEFSLGAEPRSRVRGVREEGGRAGQVAVLLADKQSLDSPGGLGSGWGVDT